MKNIWLLCVLIALAVFTYYFDELEGIKNKLAANRKAQLFELSRIGELKGLKTSSTEFFKVGEQYYTGKNHRLVDDNKIKRFLEILSGLKVRRVMTTDEVSIFKREDYFPKELYEFEFIFSGGKVKYRLGKKLDFDQSFYVEIEKDGKKKWVVAYDSTPNSGVYRKETFHRSDRKYQRLIKMALLKENFFYDLYVFKGKKGYEGGQFWEHAEIKSKRNRTYELNIADEALTPSCPKGITTDSAMFTTFSQVLLKMQGKQLYYPYRKKLLKEWKGSISLRDYDGNRHRLDLFGKYGSLTGYFLRASLNENLYELDFSVAQIFFSPHQDYCNLRPPFYEVGKVKREVFFDIDFKKGNYFKLYIPWQEKFKVGLINEDEWIPNNSSFHALFSFFSRKADMVTVVSKNASKMAFAASFSLQYQGETFFVIHASKEIQLFNFKHKYVLHYLTNNDLPIGISMKDYFMKKRNGK